MSVIDKVAGAFSGRIAIYALAVGMAATLGYTVYLKIALANEVAEGDREELEYIKKLKLLSDKALAESERSRNLEEQMNTLTQRTQHAFQEEQQRNQDALAQLVHDRTRVRDSIRVVATGSDQTPGAAAASCSARAATLGDSLEGTLRTEEELSARIETAWSSTRALLEYSRIVGQRTAEVVPLQ